MHCSPKTGHETPVHFYPTGVSHSVGFGPLLNSMLCGWISHPAITPRPSGALPTMDCMPKFNYPHKICGDVECLVYPFCVQVIINVRTSHINPRFRHHFRWKTIGMCIGVLGNLTVKYYWNSGNAVLVLWLYGIFYMKIKSGHKVHIRNN